jgi:hypothetical protein
LLRSGAFWLLLSGAVIDPEFWELGRPGFVPALSFWGVAGSVVGVCVPVVDGAAAADADVLGVCCVVLVCAGAEDAEVAELLDGFCAFMLLLGEACAAGAAMPVFAAAEGPPPVLPDPQWSAISVTLLTWKAFLTAFVDVWVLLGAADAPVGFAEFVSGLEGFPLAPDLLPEALDAVAAWPVSDTSWPTWLASASALPVRVYTVPVRSSVMV